MYSLLGLFGFKIPLLYGEGSRAFQRLQQEITKQSTDQSIFVWRLKRQSHRLPGDLFAPSRGSFKACNDIIATRDAAFCCATFELNNLGLRIRAPVLDERGVILSCAVRGNPLPMLLPLAKTEIGTDVYECAKKTAGSVEPMSALNKAVIRDITIIRRPRVPVNGTFDLGQHPMTIWINNRLVPEALQVGGFYPAESWNEVKHLTTLPSWGGEQSFGLELEFRYLVRLLGDARLTSSRWNISAAVHSSETEGITCSVSSSDCLGLRLSALARKSHCRRLVTRSLGI